MFRAYGANVSSHPTAATAAEPPSANSPTQSTSVKGNSSLLFNQIENNLRSWHSANYSPWPQSSALMTNNSSSPLNGGTGDCGGQLHGGRPITNQHHYGGQRQPQVQATPPAAASAVEYENVLRLMMSSATIEQGKSRTGTNHSSRLNGKLFVKLYWPHKSECDMEVPGRVGSWLGDGNLW